MQKRICIFDFSAPEIQVGVLVDKHFEVIDFNLPWEIGFQTGTDGTLIACFEKALDQLDANHPTVVRFAELDAHFKEITDAETLQCLFYAFFEEILHRRLPEYGYTIEAISVYVIIPYQWKPMHRQELRRAFKRIKSNSGGEGFSPPNLMLRSILSQVLCLAVYYQKTWEELLANENELHLFLVDFTRHDLVLYRLSCEQSADYIKVELCDILRFPRPPTDIERQVSDVQNVLKAIGKTVPIVVGFSGAIGHLGRAIIELLHARLSVNFLKPQETAALLGGAELISQFEVPRDTGRSPAKPFHFVCDFCFGVRLPDGQWVELIPKGWTQPYHRKKAFRVTGTFEKFNIHLFCGLSLTDNSDTHHLAMLEIDAPENSNFSSRNPQEFILSVTLEEPTCGTFAVHLPGQSELKTAEFTVPVLMD